MTYTPLHLDWPGMLNARDLGGMPLSGGGSVAVRALVRSESTSWLEPDGVARLRAYGLSRIIDLRRPAQVLESPAPFSGEPPEILNLPVQRDGDPVEGPWAHLYLGMLDRHPDLFARAVGAIADAPQGPVLVHFAAGKDRTGLVVAFALSLAGADDDVIADDYALTAIRLESRWVSHAEKLDRARQELAERNAARRAAGEDDVVEDLPGWLHPERNTLGTRDVMLDTLAAVRSKYGSVLGYLTRGGFTSAQHATLIRRLRAEQAVESDDRN